MEVKEAKQEAFTSSTTSTVQSQQRRYVTTTKKTFKQITSKLSIENININKYSLFIV